MPRPIRLPYVVLPVLFGVFAACGGAAPRRPTVVTPPPVLVSTTTVVSTDCDDDAPALYARLPFDRLPIQPLRVAEWPDDEPLLRRCIALEHGGRTFTLIAAFAMGSAATNRVVVGLFEGDRVLDATVLDGTETVGVAMEGDCAAAIGVGPSHAVTGLSLEEGAGASVPVLRVEVARDVCGVACGTQTFDTTLLAVRDDRLDTLLSLRTREYEYVVSNEQAEYYDCDEGEGFRRTVTVRGGTVRVCDDAEPARCLDDRLEGALLDP